MESPVRSQSPSFDTPIQFEDDETVVGIPLEPKFKTVEQHWAATALEKIHIMDLDAYNYIVAILF